MPTKIGRYVRPQIEIEYDRKALVGEGCCRFVPVVLRLCGVPTDQHVMLTVMFERTRKYQEGVALDEYDVHPRSSFLTRKGFPGYYEYAVELLARPYSEDNGTIRIKMESQAYNVLSDAVYILDSRQDAPVEHTCQKGSFRAVRMVPFIRSEADRDMLQGQFPASIAGFGGVQLPSRVPVVEQSTGATMVSLFAELGQEGGT
jgi:hypothetical protein